jgi:signal transduction histidine kinase
VHLVRAWPEALALVTALEVPEETLPAEAAPHQDVGALAPAHPHARGLAHDVPFPARARLAHELKTPLSAIAAAAEIMGDERFGALGNPRYAGYVRDIRGSAQHVLGVIDRMLADSLAEPPALQHDFAVTEIDTGEVLAATASQLTPLAERAGITLALELAPRLPHVIADATSLRQIVLNLVTNALKFTDRGGRITLAARSGGDGRLSITVSDTGSGMAVAEIERRLAPEGTAPREPRRGAAKGEGLGLGLPLVQALAAANGAELRILSAPGKGTSASVVFEKGRVVPV